MDGIGNQLDGNLSTSLYHQLEEIFLNKIVNNEWKAGERIPNELDLCGQYSVSRITIRQALAELTKKGYLTRRQGVGTYVAVPKIEQSLTSFYSFTEEFKKRGFSPSSKVLEFHMQISGKEIAQKLKLVDKNREVYYIKRLRYADDIPVALESTYLPASLFRGLSEEELESVPLYDVMREKFGIIPRTAEESIGAVNLGEKEAIYLGMKKDIAALHIERFAFNGQTCIEYTFGVIRGDMLRFHVKLD